MNVNDIRVVHKMYRLLKEYEEWEAALIMNDRAWAEGDMPRLTEELYDWLLKLQEKRNAVMSKAMIVEKHK